MQTDRSQTKVVAALLVVLAVALAVLGYRMRLQFIRRQDSSPAVVRVSSVPTRGDEVADSSRPKSTVLGWSFRNPFEAPKMTRATAGGESVVRSVEAKPVPVGLVQNIQHHTPWGSRDLANVIRIGDTLRDSTLRIENENVPVHKQDREEEGASVDKCILLATVANERGWSAVIQFGDSVINTVEIGDVLDNGFKVVSLSRDDAVLTDGKRTIVARRPG